MELIFIAFMVGLGGAVAAFVMAATAIARKEDEAAGATLQLDAIAASLLVHVLKSGGIPQDEATRQVRRGTGVAAHVTGGIDVLNWADTYARHASPQQRMQLLENAVRLVAGGKGPIPLRQYAALLDLSFGLGFHTDALARLREAYGFEYVDHARDGRPAGAQGEGRPALFARDTRSRSELLGVLGISGEPTRQELVAAYRRLVTRHHPDRYHAAVEEERNEAAARFIEITRAYEALLSMTRD